MRSKEFKALFLIVSLLATSNAFALKFTNQFLEFELPNTNWKCTLEGAEWVCQTGEESKKKDAIIVFAAKLKGADDSLEKYQEYLAKPRAFTGAASKALHSQPKYAKVIELNAQKWVDSLHLESEIDGFYTRYLATVKEDIGVLVTYSIKKNKYQDFMNEFDGMIKSLRVFRKQGAAINANTGQSLFDTTKAPGNFTAQNVFPGDEKPAEQKKPAKKQDDNMMLYLLIGAAVIGFLIWKKKRG